MRLADGTHASAGDTIITRRTTAASPISAHRLGQERRPVARRHRPRGRRPGRSPTCAPAARHPARRLRRASTSQLGYATTVHGAQGITADTCHTVATGEESRQLLYVAMTRGRHANHVYLATAGDGDPHSVITRDALLPPTAVDILARILARDDAPVSADQPADANSPTPTSCLHAAAARYHDASPPPPKTTSAPTGSAEHRHRRRQRRPGPHPTPAYPTLRAHLALLRRRRPRPGRMLLRARRRRPGLADARDPAAVLDWRLDPTGHRLDRQPGRCPGCPPSPPPSPPTPTGAPT